MEEKKKEKIAITINHYLIKKGAALQQATEKEKIIKLIRSLYPLQTQYELIRLGPNSDGGYLVPNCLEGIEACFSPGVSTVSGFEYDCIKRNMKVYMADKSVDKPNLDVDENKYHFIKKFIGATNNEDFITMDKWVKSCPLIDSSDLLLQMDIEGAEYLSFINMSDSLINRFKIMVIEFHHLHHLWDIYFYNLANTVFEKILQTHVCVHNHPNNNCKMVSHLDIEIPSVSEFTFIRKDCVTELIYRSDFPHILDYNNRDQQSMVLPRNWYKA